MRIFGAHLCSFTRSLSCAIFSSPGSRPPTTNGLLFTSIAGMLLAAEAHPGTSMVLVTHLAPAIIEATGRDDLRIDGIEARGLDEDLELIVDRTPRRNHLARSTPELIVRRLVERSEGPAKAVFASILDAF